ncbi:MAG: hypothetical protein AAGA93_16655, partial [Actinomycetota bacterium]
MSNSVLPSELQLIKALEAQVGRRFEQLEQMAPTDGSDSNTHSFANDAEHNRTTAYEVDRQGRVVGLRLRGYYPVEGDDEPGPRPTISELPTELLKFSFLKNIDLRGNDLSVLPKDLFNLDTQVQLEWSSYPTICLD